MSSNPDNTIWKQRFGSGAGALFGLPFFLLGCFFFYGGLTTDSINGSPPSVTTRVFFCGFSSIFILIGFAIITHFKRFIINKSDQTIKSQWGFVFAFKTTITPLADVQGVKLSKEVRSSGSGSKKKSTTVYPVRLLSNPDNIDINEPRDAIKARSQAEQLSKFLNLPMHDNTRGEESIRQAHQLDDNVAQRLTADNQSTRRPASLASLYSRMHESIADNGRAQYNIRFPSIASSYAWVAYAGGLALVTMIALVLWQLKDVGLDVNQDNYFFNVFFELLSIGIIVPALFAGLLLKLLKLVLPSWEFIITSESLVITKRFFGVPLTTELSNNQIEELEVKPQGTANNGMMFLVTDKQQLALARGQDFEELKYTRELIIYAMSQ